MKVGFQTELRAGIRNIWNSRIVHGIRVAQLPSIDILTEVYFFSLQRDEYPQIMPFNSELK